jgi:hypothetical protein
MSAKSNRCHNTFMVGHEGEGALKAEFNGKMYCTVCSQPYCPKCHLVMTYYKGYGSAKAGFRCDHCSAEFNRLQTEIRHD